MVVRVNVGLPEGWAGFRGGSIIRSTPPQNTCGTLTCLWFFVEGAGVHGFGVGYRHHRGAGYCNTEWRVRANRHGKFSIPAIGGVAVVAGKRFCMRKSGKGYFALCRGANTANHVVIRKNRAGHTTPRLAGRRRGGMEAAL